MTAQPARRKAARAPSAPQEATQTRRLALESLRDTLAEAITEVRAGAGAEKQAQLAPLAKQYRDTLDALDKLPAGQASPLDELKKRRAARASAAPVSPRSARKVVGGTGSGRVGSIRGSDPGPVAGTRPRRSAGRSS